MVVRVRPPADFASFSLRQESREGQSSRVEDGNKSYHPNNEHPRAVIAFGREAMELPSPLTAEVLKRMIGSLGPRDG
jgi:hypothetical protein